MRIIDRRLILVLIGALLATTAAGGAELSRGGGDPPAAGALKAALLYKITRFVTWPEDAFEGEASPVVFGVLGEGEITAPLERILPGRELSGRRAIVRRLVDLEGAADCHVLFVVSGQEGRLPELLELLGTAPTLLAGESKWFAHQGGHLNFYSRAASLRFEINLRAVKAAGMEMSAKLLRLARIVEE